MTIGAVGRIGPGAEADIVERHLERARRLGRGLGITRIDLVERAESRLADADRRKAEEASALLALAGDGAVIALDERGEAVDSRGFASLLDPGRGLKDVALLIGGPDGHGAAVRERATRLVGFGRMTLPHALVRAVLVEQVYRALTILAGHPYHRD